MSAAAAAATVAQEIAAALAESRPTVAEIDLDALAANYRAVAAHAAGCEVMPVVKADAYGHGAVQVARALAEAGARRFAVAIPEEGVSLRAAAIEGEILVLGASTLAQVPLVRRARLTPSVYGLPFLRELATQVAASGEALEFHLKIDTGMGRLGLQPQETGAAIEILNATPLLRLRGLFTHFSSADEAANPKTRAQVERFDAVVALLREHNLAGGAGRPRTGNEVPLHLANSAGTLGHPDAFGDLVRPGLALYGVAPAPGLAAVPLLPVLSWRTAIVHLKEVPAGTALGYGETFVTARPSRIATLPVGYDDGYNRLLGNRAHVLVGGRPAPVVGRVSMDLTLVDVTGIPEAQMGSMVTLLGEQGGARVGAELLAEWANTIPYEVLCRIGRRVPRLYRRGGQAVALAGLAAPLPAPPPSPVKAT